MGLDQTFRFVSGRFRPAPELLCHCYLTEGTLNTNYGRYVSFDMIIHLLIHIFLFSVFQVED